MTHQHWTERSTDDYQYKIGSDFVLQLTDKMESDPKTSRKQLSKVLGVSVGRVSQVLNNPGNLGLRSIIQYARGVGMKVAVIAYDDNDPENERGPINSAVFEKCWRKCGSPTDFFDLSDSETTADNRNWQSFRLMLTTVHYEADEDSSRDVTISLRDDIRESAITTLTPGGELHA